MSTTPPFPCSIVGILTPLVGFLLHLRSAEASWRSWVGFKIFLRSFYPEYGARVCPLLAGRCRQVTSLSIMLKSNALRSIFRMESEAKMKENVVKPGCWAGAVQELMHCGSGPCFCGTWIKFPWAVPVSGCLELRLGAPCPCRSHLGVEMVLGSAVGSAGCWLLSPGSRRASSNAHVGDLTAWR